MGRGSVGPAGPQAACGPVRPADRPVRSELPLGTGGAGREPPFRLCAHALHQDVRPRGGFRRQPGVGDALQGPVTACFPGRCRRRVGAAAAGEGGRGLRSPASRCRESPAHGPAPPSCRPAEFSPCCVAEDTVSFWFKYVRDVRPSVDVTNELHRGRRRVSVRTGATEPGTCRSTVRLGEEGPRRLGWLVPRVREGPACRPVAASRLLNPRPVSSVRSAAAPSGIDSDAILSCCRLGGPPR